MVNTHEMNLDPKTDPALVGGAAWIATVAAVVAGGFDLTIFQVFLLLGPLVVVPLGRPLIAQRRTAVAGGAVEAAALLVVGAFVVAPGAVATAMTLPWLVATVALTAGEARHRWQDRVPGTGTWWLAPLLAVAAPAWLVVGAVSLTASRAATTPFGLTPELIELGAMHFSFAGFAATVLALCIVRRSPRTRTAALAAIATVGGATVVAIGHLTIRPLELVGASSMTVGVLLLGVLGWSLAPRRTLARVLLRIAALAVIVPMILALQYAWALTTGGTHLPYTTIARIHGTLNALGFSVGGLVAWRLVARSDRSAPPTLGRADAHAAPVHADVIGTGG